MPDEDLLDSLIDRIAEAVVEKIDQRRKIDLIAEAVLARLEEQGLAKKPTADAAPARHKARAGAKKKGGERGLNRGQKG
jgi:hypothetical protein